MKISFQHETTCCDGVTYQIKGNLARNNWNIEPIQFCRICIQNKPVFFSISKFPANARWYLIIYSSFFFASSMLLYSNTTQNCRKTHCYMTFHSVLFQKQYEISPWLKQSRNAVFDVIGGHMPDRWTNWQNEPLIEMRSW